MVNIGCRRAQVENARFDTTRSTVEQLFAPVDVPDSAMPGARVMCRYTGTMATVLGVSGVRGKPALFLQLDELAGATPYIGDASYVRRWRVADNLPPLAEVGARVVLPPVNPRNCDYSPNQLGAMELDLLAPRKLAGLEPLATVVLASDKASASTTLEVLGVGREGMYLCRAVRGEAPVLEDIVALPHGTEVRVTAQRPCRVLPNPAAAKAAAAAGGATGASRISDAARRLGIPNTTRQVKYHTVRERPDDKLVYNFPWLIGTTNPRCAFLDADPDRCFRYFGLIPGQRTSMPNDSVAIGMQHNGPNGEIDMFFHVDSCEGAGTYSDGSDMTLEGAPLTLHPRPTYHPYFGFRQPLTSLTIKQNSWPMPSVPLPPASSLTRRYNTHFGIIDVDIGNSLTRLGLRHGQAVRDNDGDLMAIIGVGKNPCQGDKPMIFLAFSGNIYTVGDGTPLILYNECFPADLFQSNGDGAHPVQAKVWRYDKLPMMASFNTPFPSGWNGKGPVVNLCQDPAHVFKLFGLRPGQCVNGTGVVAGASRESDDDVALMIQYNGALGLLRVPEGKTVHASNIFVAVPEPQLAAIDLSPRPLRRDDTCTHDFWFAQYLNPDDYETASSSSSDDDGSKGSKEKKEKKRRLRPPRVAPVCIDVDPDRCERYFGVRPGMRFDHDKCVVVGIWQDDSDDTVNMVFQKDDHPAAILCGYTQISPMHHVRDADVARAAAAESAPSEYAVSRDAGTYRIEVLPLDPADRLDESEPVRFNDDGSFSACMIDVDPARCKRYVGFVPGTRFALPFCTFVGLRIIGNGTDISALKVVPMFQRDGETGAILFRPGKRLLRHQGHVYPPAPERSLHHWVHRHPPTPHRLFETPKPPQDPKLYNLTFRYWYCETTTMLDNSDAALARVGLKFGQRAVLDETIVLTILGISRSSSDDDEFAVFAIIDGGRASAITVGTNIWLSEEIIKPEPIVVEKRTFKHQEERPRMRLRLTAPFPYGVTHPTKPALFDVDPTRMRAYFGCVSGTRVNGNATIIGMRKLADDSGRVGLFGIVDSRPGVGVWAEDDELHVSQTVVDTKLALRRVLKEGTGAADPELEGMAYQQSTFFGGADDGHGGDAFGEVLGGALDEVVARSQVMYSATYPLTRPENLAALKFVTDSAYDPSRADPINRRLIAMGTADPEMALFTSHIFLQNEVPIVSWFTPFKLVDGDRPIVECMTDDVAMRTLFELSHGNGSKNKEARGGWETKLFNSIYDAAPVECRPKYGLFNVFGDPSGPRVEGNQYGDCFMVFSPELRCFATMTPFDSCGIARGECNVATISDGLTKVLSQFKVEGDELENFVDVATGNVSFVESGRTYYKEMQLHCGVYFQEHMTHIVVADKYFLRGDDLHLLYNFALKNGAFIISVASMHILADARLKSKEEIAALAIEHGALPTGHCTRRNAVLQCGPQVAENRGVFRALADAICREEMRRVRNIIFGTSRHTTWAPKALHRE